MHSIVLSHWTTKKKTVHPYDTSWPCRCPWNPATLWQGLRLCFEEVHRHLRVSASWKNDRNDHEVHRHQDLSSPQGLSNVTSLRITMKCQMPLSNKARKKEKRWYVFMICQLIPSLKSYLRNPTSHLHQDVNISLMLLSEDSKWLPLPQGASHTIAHSQSLRATKTAVNPSTISGCRRASVTGPRMHLETPLEPFQDLDAAMALDELGVSREDKLFPRRNGDQCLAAPAVDWWRKASNYGMLKWCVFFGLELWECILLYCTPFGCVGNYIEHWKVVFIFSSCTRLATPLSDSGYWQSQGHQKYELEYEQAENETADSSNNNWHMPLEFGNLFRLQRSAVACTILHQRREVFARKWYFQNASA